MRRDERYDVVVVGGGPGGYVAALRASQLGARVALIDDRGLGGVCLHEGCIPTKLLLHYAQLLEGMGAALKKGIFQGEMRLEYARLREAKEEVIKRLEGGIKYLVKKGSIELIRGWARLAGPDLLKVKEKGEEGREMLVRGRSIIIATGSEPVRPPIPGAYGEGVLTSDQFLELEELPSSAIIVGGGPEGVEFASLLNAFGCKVQLVEMLPRLLPLEDAELGEGLARIMKRKGIEVLVGRRVTSIEDGEGIKVVRLEGEGSGGSLEAEVVLLATGRRPKVEGLGLEAVGVRYDAKGIRVDEGMRTNVEGIYAIGDVAGRALLAYTASHEGVVAAENALGLQARMSYDPLPRCVFSIPEVGAVGMSEEEARAQGYRVKVGRFPFRANGKALSMDNYEGFVKVLLDEEDGRLLGVHILGPDAAEMIHAAALAMKLKARAEELVEALFIHPTLSEAFREALLAALGRPLHL